MDGLHWSTIDWAATGTMLQGIGAIVGAVAIIIAALIGGGTLKAWRRQQIFQKHMELAERVLTLVVRAEEEIRSIRSPLKTAAELAQAARNLEANGIDEKSQPRDKWRQLTVAQSTFDRISQYQSTWIDLQSIKPSAFVYFGENISKNIEIILRQIHLINIDAEAYGHDDNSDLEFSRKLRETLSFSRSGGRKDEIGENVAAAVNAIREQLQPLLQDVATATTKAVNEFIVEVLKLGASRFFPFW